ncbi:MAG: hypothetical protein UT54_C0003G0025 [Candidatus Daviesbacteria bacterium GW2011_GWB1_39_5]|uniref:Peptidase M23 domain-containing protein n=1 Tax=Candidatus Daviesbacteria bacterium GW2011_GWC2_40_12 TaxID=1618431 RepID=A0A0G0TXV2_9BACT|nr:MAG: hypothetical protein UT04_C0047G0003 [Candidatus Daviesbacteria bacterium GW2011_GWF2_38_7]KKR17455.1 MAG: hypothetical protein UT45_C0001G0130 [Candidatus Daviesbacteria bacterium GW2011_GWA2_39_33]KKR25407.1 MAG: hypothetical protein UT54_C0003G0025 [Candidatus Daviesbacteria bacterium GW2011_GWB1_39_5]KKR42832.1 MAG: hypothetical protein UT77_C0001G0283 [Candidatus Daviesbacteria bacterium GW2011_GWC2_40_12]OGE21590.1 MAG: hypothetical protein A2778_05385 [Candidatus Daviesbacteria b
MADIIRSIEPFELTQGFGDNPQAYARFGLKGHNGWDLRTQYPDTPKGFRNILTSWLSKFYTQGNEGNDGFGLYFEVIVQLYNTYKLTYAHCNSIENFQTKNEGEAMGISDNTGNSTGSHLHLTVKRGSLQNGKFISDNYNNGYFGAIEPQEFYDELRQYKKEKGTTQNPEGCLVPNTLEWRQKYEEIVSSANKWAETLKILEITDDPNTTPPDRIKSTIAGYKSRETDLNNKLNEKQQQIDVANRELENRKEQVSRMEKGLLDKEKYYKSQIDALNKQIKNGSESLPLAQARIGVLEKELDEANKAKGGALLGAEEYKTKFESSQKGTLIPTPQIIFSLIIQYIGNSLKPKGGDKHG